MSIYFFAYVLLDMYISYFIPIHDLRDYSQDGGYAEMFFPQPPQRRVFI